jgi:HK97 family phage prohead protease
MTMMTLPPQDRTRYATLNTVNGRKVSGYAARFDVLSSPGTIGGGARELLERGCFAAALAAPGLDLRLYWGHDRNRILARQSAGNLRVWEDKIGLRFEATLPMTSMGDEALELVRAGIVKEMSFGFSMLGGRERKTTVNGETVYRVSKVGKLREISIVTEPAYPETSVENRGRAGQRSPAEVLRAARQRIRETEPRLRISERAVYGPDSPHSWFRDMIIDAALRVVPTGRKPTAFDPPAAYKDTPIVARDPGLSQLVSMYAGQLSGIQARLRQVAAECEYRAASDSTNFAGLVAPAFIVELFATAARAKGILPSVLRTEPLPDAGLVVKTGRFTTGATVTPQSAEGAAGSTTATATTNDDEPVAYLSGWQDISIQAFMRGGNGGLDVQLAKEYGAAMAALVDDQIISGSGGANALKGFRNVAGIGTQTYADASPTPGEFYVQLAAAYSSHSAAIGQPPDLLLIHPRRYGWMAFAVDGNGQPFELPPSIPVEIVQVPAIPTNVGAGTEDIAILLTREEVPYLPGQAWFRAWPQPVGQQGQVRVIIQQFAALLGGRRPRAITIISGSGLIAV